MPSSPRSISGGSVTHRYRRGGSSSTAGEPYDFKVSRSGSTNRVCVSPSKMAIRPPREGSKQGRVSTGQGRRGGSPPSLPRSTVPTADGGSSLGASPQTHRRASRPFATDSAEKQSLPTAAPPRQENPSPLKISIRPPKCFLYISCTLP